MDKKEVTCQYCKHHSNKPSRCNKFNKYVGRKHKCIEFKHK